MPSWDEVEAETPELAVLARGFLDAHAYETLANLRRDPRFTLHGGCADPPEWTGDAKISGRAEGALAALYVDLGRYVLAAG